LKIKDAPGFEKIGRSVVCTDATALKTYKIRRAKANEIEVVKEDINRLKQQMNRIEDLLIKALNGAN